MCATLLEPGQSIRPDIDETQVKRFLESLYGKTGKVIKELNGYDDKNFYIETASDEKFIFKVMNSMDSKDTDFVECQNGVMSFLYSSQIKCPKPVLSVNNSFYEIVELNSNKHIIRLMLYIEGMLLRDVKSWNQIAYDVGKMANYVDRYLEKGLEDKCIEIAKKRSHIWMLKNVPEVEKFSFAITDKTKLKLVKEVIEEFKMKVIPLIDKLPSGVIHGDLNEQNILVEETESGCYKIAGLLDFGDMQYSCYVFELALAMTYLILASGSIDTGFRTLSGYLENRSLTREENQVLKLCICARLAQSLTLGAYSHMEDPDNIYVLSTERSNGWNLLKELKDYDDRKFSLKI